ncbi:MAG: response regulator transcription factor [Clostridiales bacterium]|nr:response regulator transcription factor [Clostridiales bacterium]
MLNNQYHILVADDDPDLLDILNIMLKGEGYLVTNAQNGEEAVKRADETVDLIILDIMMPNMNGYTACYEMRKITNAPILFLSAMSGDSDKATAFLAGGDDYMCKPYSAAELISRVKSMLRRYHIYQGINNRQEKDEKCKLSIELMNDNMVILDGKTIKLTYIEYEILKLLLNNRGEIISTSEMFEKIWAEPFAQNAANTIMVHMLRLRRKLDQNSDHPKLIKTAWGRGYYIEKE